MPGNGGAEQLPRTAGTLLRPLGSAPTSCFPKPMRLRCSTSSTLEVLGPRSRRTPPPYASSVTARDACGGAPGGSAPKPSARLALSLTASPPASLASITSALHLKVPRTVTSNSRGFVRACQAALDGVRPLSPSPTLDVGLLRKCFALPARSAAPSASAATEAAPSSDTTGLAPTDLCTEKASGPRLEPALYAERDASVSS
mmetsp:Transcript_82221/g.228152  ORF Transcript_82221/g.228152 Transcript_82221/m.228152 type:complete len:201 (-) Transcript_82221:677-1279(-)